MTDIRYDYVETDGTINALYPRADFAHADSTTSRGVLSVEKDIDALALWIRTRLDGNLPGGVRLSSRTDARNGLYSIRNIVVA